MRSSRRSLQWRALFVLGMILLLAICYAVIPPGMAHADIGEESHLGFLQADEKEEDRGPKWITRNLVEGMSIEVCSTDFPRATSRAVTRWNTAIGVKVLKFSTRCDTGVGNWTAKDGVVSVTVSMGVRSRGLYGSVPEVVTDMVCPYHRSRACAGFDRMEYYEGFTEATDQWRSYHGRAQIIMNPRFYLNDISARYVPPGSGRDLVHDIAHELGHVLALADYYCDHVGHPDYLAGSTNPNEKSLLNSWNLEPQCDPTNGAPTNLDKNDYRAAYLPAKVTDVNASANGSTVALTWRQRATFVESHFEIQRASGTGWVEVGNASVNAEAATLSNQPGGLQRYRVVGATKALPSGPKDHGHAHGVASAAVSVEVPYRIPSIDSFSGSGTTLTASFTWDGTAPRYLSWMLYRSTSESGSFNEVGSAVVDSDSPVSFSGQARGYWYKLRGRTCEHRADPGVPPDGVRGQQAIDLVEVCGSWSGFSTPVQIRRTTVAPRPPMPADTFEDREVVRSSWTAWELEGDGTVICYFQQYRYTRFVIESWITTHSWNGTRWAPSTSLFLTSDVMTRKTPLPGVRPISCFLSSDQSGVSGASAAPLQFLLEGDYVFRWGDKYVSFSVPKNARINLNWRVLASGVRAAVLTDGGTGEVLVHPGAVAATTDEADQRSTALQSIERSLRQTSSVSAQGAGAPGVACVVVSSDASEPQVDLDANRCATAASGGQLRITADGRELSLTLTADRHWIMARVRVGVGGEYGPIALFDVSTTSSLLLDPVTGSEVGRTISEGADSTLVGLFDAIVASVKRIESANDSP